MFNIQRESQSDTDKVYCRPETIVEAHKKDRGDQMKIAPRSTVPRYHAGSCGVQLQIDMIMYVRFDLNLARAERKLTSALRQAPRCW